jgi:hypothetical protein
MGIADVIMPVGTVFGCCAFTGLVPPRSLKLVLTYLKIESHWAISNVDTRPRARIRVAAEGVCGGSVRAQAAATMVVGEAVRATGSGAPMCGGKSWW